MKRGRERGRGGLAGWLMGGCQQEREGGRGDKSLSPAGWLAGVAAAVGTPGCFE